MAENASTKKDVNLDATRLERVLLGDNSIQGISRVLGLVLVYVAASSAFFSWLIG